MPYLTVGVEHRTSPLAVRERVALSPEGIEAASRALGQDGAIQEIAIVSTCNRTELYLFAGEGEEEAAEQVARAYLVELDGGIAPYLQSWPGMSAAEHLLRVACGLESQVLGEPQVLGQVRAALGIAQRL